jgi:hypothetical protein
MDIALIINGINGVSDINVAYMQLKDISNYHVGKREVSIRINNQEKNYSGDCYLFKRRIDLIKELLEKPEKVDPTFIHFLADPIKSIVNGENYLKEFGDIFFTEKEIDGINILAKQYEPSHTKFLSLMEKISLENLVSTKNSKKPRTRNTKVKV